MCGFLFDPLFVMQYLASYLVFNNHLAEEGRADCALAIMWLLVFCDFLAVSCSLIMAFHILTCSFR